MANDVMSDTHLTQDEVLQSLSAVKHKYQAFMLEAYLRQGLRDIGRTIGGIATPLMQRIAMVLIKPEAIAGGRALPIVDYLETHAFAPIAFRSVRLNRNLINTIWLYQWNVATLDRLDLAESLYCAGDSLVVFLRDDQFDGKAPASVRLRKLKGPAQPEMRAEHHLRSVIDAPNRTMSMVHACDEPIDLVRETAILFDRAERWDLYSALVTSYGGDASADLRRRLAEMTSASTQNELSWHRSLARLREHVPDAVFRKVMGLLKARSDAGETSQRLPWLDINLLLQTEVPALDAWDRLVIGATLIEHDEPGTQCTIDDDGVAHWAAGLGQIQPLPTSFGVH